jgi:hypothetical protein
LIESVVGETLFIVLFLWLLMVRGDGDPIGGDRRVASVSGCQSWLNGTLPDPALKRSPREAHEPPAKPHVGHAALCD